jgi:hypothetical protein
MMMTMFGFQVIFQGNDQGLAVQLERLLYSMLKKYITISHLSNIFHFTLLLAAGDSFVSTCHVIYILNLFCMRLRRSRDC